MEQVPPELIGRIRQNVGLLRQRIAVAARDGLRDPGEIALIGVTKTHPSVVAAAAALAGLNDIGENRVQEAAAKRPEAERMMVAAGADPTMVRWHMIGRLQSNKVAKAAALFEVIQSVDSAQLAQRLSRAAGDLGRRLQVFIELNCSFEPTKGGVAPEGVEDLALYIASLDALDLAGLMTLGPHTTDRAAIRRSLDLLAYTGRAFRERHPDVMGPMLSMGMSDDFEIAIAAGSTMVRLGTALFGPRRAYA